MISQMAVLKVSKKQMKGIVRDRLYTNKAQPFDNQFVKKKSDAKENEDDQKAP